jgi:hypothetical protein
MILFFLLMTFIALGESKISDLGIKLLKEIKKLI